MDDEHSLLVSRLMAWELNYSRWVDLLLAELVQRFGEAKAKEIFPYWPDNAPLIIPKESEGKDKLLKTFVRCLMRK